MKRALTLVIHYHGSREVVGQLEFENETFIFRCAFTEREIPKRAGFRFDAETKSWCTRSMAAASRLKTYAVGAAREKLESATISVKPWADAVVYPAHEKPYAHQLEAARFALARNRAYLGLDAGLGKTAVAAMVINTLDLPALYICPPFLVRNTEEELARWGAVATIIPDSMLEKVCAPPTVRKKHVLIVDESHRFKNKTTKRTRALFERFYPAAARVYFMSGTPMPNRPRELYTVLSKAAPETIDFMSEFQFGKKFCAGFDNGFGWDFNGASNLPELRRRVIHPAGPFMLRMRKKDVLDLPPKIEEILLLDRDAPPRIARMEKKILEHVSPEDLLAGELGKAGEELHLATYRRLLGEAKVGSSAAYIDSLLRETTESILVFAIHKETIAKLSTILSEFNPLVITGDTPMSERHRIVKKFQTEPKRRLFIGNIQAAGTGFTLTKATRVCFVEYSWTPGDNSQASDRAHRIGQNESVYVQYFCFRNSIDRKVIETLLRKAQHLEHV